MKKQKPPMKRLSVQDVCHLVEARLLLEEALAEHVGDLTVGQDRFRKKVRRFLNKTKE